MHAYIIATLRATPTVYITAPGYTTKLVMCTPQCLRTPTMPVCTTAAAATADVCATMPVYTAVP
eukprot:1940702-Pyramimonas_sp.AAC.1